MKARDLDDPEVYREYLEANLRVLTMAPLRHAPMNDLDSLELIHNLTSIYRKVQNGLLIVLGHTPGKEN